MNHLVTLRGYRPGVWTSILINVATTGCCCWSGVGGIRPDYDYSSTQKIRTCLKATSFCEFQSGRRQDWHGDVVGRHPSSEVAPPGTVPSLGGPPGVTLPRDVNEIKLFFLPEFRKNTR